MSLRLRTFFYIISDFLSAGMAWTLFNYYRKTQIDPLKTGESSAEIFDNQFYISVIIYSLLGTRSGFGAKNDTIPSPNVFKMFNLSTSNKFLP